ncbi:hypothetical protein CARUB_v10006247mg [Capsella rubella]|uniref:non-specific serine/threonine protein kinase n=1 Tax=Capsella rubella TaxID=81985 RepID=R0H2V6_9BRAS|nr:SNF1-related protein kinase catalytic subunit alpha KIN11 [Capsella rubella]EOA17843.1 hypothetical protein CARUB_v10006247mg [Capsella rubella]
MKGSSKTSSSTSKKALDLPNYRIVKTVGRGSFAKVKLAEHIATGLNVAIKIFNRLKMKDTEMDFKVQRENRIVQSLTHPNIIRHYEVIETPKKIYVVMEYIKSGELFDYIIENGKVPQDKARHLFQQLISGVEYCHRNRVIHRDIKLENVLMESESKIKILDFGLSNVMEDGDTLKTSCGSPNYAAPEVISGNPYSGPGVDVWSCGVILYALLSGYLPFIDEHLPSLYNTIMRGEYRIPFHLPSLARDLISRMLTVDPFRRITIPEIRRHPWFIVNLSPSCFLPLVDATDEQAKIEEEIVQKVVDMGFDRDQVLTSFANKVQNEATVAYNLILDNQDQNGVPNDNPQSM